MRVVYVIQNLINNKKYVGQTKNFVKRKAGHLYDVKRGCEKPLYRAIRKYGVENFSFEIIEECLDEIINEREQHWVAHFDSFNPEKGYNLTPSGRYNNIEIVSEETKHKLSQLFSGDKNPCFGRVGALHPMFGKHHSNEARMKISCGLEKAMKEGRLKPFSWQGKTHKQETKEKIGKANSISQKGEKNSQFGLIWINHPILKTSTKIKKEEFETYTQQGWVKGRKMKW